VIAASEEAARREFEAVIAALLRDRNSDEELRHEPH
jgi:hypothetical protein